MKNLLRCRCGHSLRVHQYNGCAHGRKVVAGYLFTLCQYCQGFRFSLLQTIKRGFMAFFDERLMPARHVLSLYDGGRSVDELARILGVPPSLMRTRLAELLDTRAALAC